MNNTIQINQSSQKFKEILTARCIINQWLSTSPVLLHQLPLQCLLTHDCYLLINKLGLLQHLLINKSGAWETFVDQQIWSIRVNT